MPADGLGQRENPLSPLWRPGFMIPLRDPKPWRSLSPDGFMTSMLAPPDSLIASIQDRRRPLATPLPPSERMGILLVPPGSGKTPGSSNA